MEKKTLGAKVQNTIILQLYFCAKNNNLVSKIGGLFEKFHNQLFWLKNKQFKYAAIC